MNSFRIESLTSLPNKTQRSITISTSEDSISLTTYLQTRCVIQQNYHSILLQTLSQSQTHVQLITKLMQAYTEINQVTLKTQIQSHLYS